MTEALKQFLNSLHRNAHAVKLVEPKWIAEEKLAIKINKLTNETKAQRKIRIFNEWEEILNG